MKTQDEARALGYQDRILSLPGEFTSGRTFADPALNEAYDQGVNAAERESPDSVKALQESFWRNWDRRSGGIC